MVARPNPSKVIMQLPQMDAKAPVSSESQKTSGSANNPPPLEDAPVCASTPWPEAGRMSSNLFALRRIGQFPLPTILWLPQSPNLLLRLNPRNQISQPPVQQHQDQSDVDGDQTLSFARMQKKTGMATTRTNSNKPTKTLRQKIHSRWILSRPKAWNKPWVRTLSTPKSTRYHKIHSPPRHSPLMFQTDAQNNHVLEESGKRRWKG